MSSRAKNFRRRSDGELNGGEEMEKEKGKPTPPPPSTAKQTVSQPKPSKASAPKRLSFADDDEEADDGPTPPSRPLSSSSSSRLRYNLASKDRVRMPAPSIPSNVQPQAGEYTQERLRELQKNARPLGGAASSKTQPPESTGEPVVVLRGLLKPTPPPIPRREAEKGEDGLKEDLDDKADAEASRQQFADLGIDRRGKESSLGAIPDQATIAAIRAKRERLRQLRGAAPDYISLDGGGVMSSGPAGNVSSDEEESDFHGRIALFGDKVDDGEKKGVFEVIDDRVAPVIEARVVDGGYRDVDVDVDDDEDEEERRWEEEQFRKGLGKRIDDASAHLVTSGVNVVAPVQPQPPVYSGIPYQTSLSGSSATSFTRSVEVMSIRQQAEVASQALKQNISKLKETHSRTLASLRKTDESLFEALNDITTLEKSLEVAGEKFVFMQQLRDFTSVMCDFLQDKAPFIEELEEQMQKLHEERASAITERRVADIADEAIEIEAAVNAVITILSKGSGAAFISAATTAAQAASVAARENANLPVQLDEFGRDVNLQKRMDLARRAEARKRRKARSDSKRISYSGRDLMYQRIEGESSTDESDSESSAYQSTRAELLQTAGQVFSDAADEYSKISSVKERFDRWKKQYLSSYRDAYMSLSAPAIFSPYVRLELLKWDPLYTKTDFNDMDWYNILFDYGMPGKDHQLDPGDADVDLIPLLVEKVALPILHHEIAHCWDMLSTERTENAVFATNLVITYVPASSDALRELLVVIRSRLDEAIISLKVPTWSSVVTNMVPGAAQLAAYRFGMSVRLLRNICLWKDILALPVLEKLALEELLGKRLLPHVRSVMPNIHDAISRTERIVASLSGVWSGPNVTSDHSLKLQPLVDCVGEVGRRLEKRQASGLSQEETTGLARRLKKILVELNEYDRARAILRTFQLKEAL